MEAPAITALICTHNRAARVATAIDSLLAQDLPPDQFEIVVVDNGSTDDTGRRVMQYGNPVRLVAEPRVGLSHARNAGWRAARGAFIAMLDDDAVADRDWLRVLVQAFTTISPRPACVGGRIRPIWETPRPGWLSDKLLQNLTVLDWGATAHAVVDLRREWLAGANFAVRRDVLERLGGFSDRLGRIGGDLLSGEEILLQRRLLAGGATCWYEPGAQVGHVIPADRLSSRWFRRRAFAQGLSDARIWHLERTEGASRLREMSEHLRPLLRAGFGLAGLVRTDPARLEDDCGVLWRLGFVRGLLTSP
jgi:glycosyltransferase involved in cell wall biosynthesis